MVNLKGRPHLFWLGLAVLTLVVESALFYSISTSFAASEQWAIHTHQVLEKIDTLVSDLTDAETGQRGYLLTGQDRYLEPYNTAVQAIPGQFEELRKLTADNPRQQSRIEKLRPLVTAKMAERKETIDLRRTGRGDQAIAVVASDRGKQIMDRIRLEIQAMRADELSLLDQRNRTRLARARLLILVMACGAGILLLVLLAGSSSINRSTTARALAEAAERTHRELLQVTLTSIGDGVIATDPEGRVTLINPVAAQLTGWPPEEAQGQPLETVFPIRNEETGNKVENPALRAILERTIVGLANHTVLISRSGKRIPLEDSGAAIVGASGNVLGAVLIFRDVSQKRAEEANVLRRDRMARFSFDAILITDGQRRIQFWNRGAIELYGWDEAEVRDKVSYDFLHTSPPIAEVDEVLLKAGQWRGELVHTCKDGSVVTVESRQVLLRDAEGKVDGVLEINRDITERRKSEEALRESEGQFRALANAIPQLCWTANADGGISWYNQRWYEYTGTRPEQMAGWGWQSVHDPEALPKVLERWKVSIATGEPFDMVFPLRGADGVFRPFLTRVMPVHDADGKVARWFGTNTDISEQRKIEEALFASESRFRALLDSASQGVAAVDESGRMVLVNAKTEEMFGYTRDELLSQPLEVLLPERHRGAHAGHLRDYFAHPYARAMGLGMDLCGRSKDGVEFPIEVSLSCTEQGGSRLAMALITDTTERKKAEERLRQAQKLESLGLLAGGVAHDFNNLLVGVLGNASMAQELLPPDNVAAELLEGVVRSGQQAAHLTRQMLAYSGKGKFLVEPLDLSALIPEMFGLVQPSLPKKISVSFDLAPVVPAIEADRGQVQQVFMNLVLNAGEAIGSHEGLLTVRTGVQDVDERYMRFHLEAASLRPGKFVCLEVRDTGCGMDEATRVRAFDPFFTTKFTGRGLGLAAVAGIVRSHKGAITVSSTPGKGSCFTVLFPTVEHAVEASPVAPRETALRGTGVVLVVDDEPFVREMAKKALEHQGYTVLLAESGLGAIDAFRRHPGEIALVVLDLSMPLMSGEEALPELRKIRPEVKVVVSSGYSEAETMTLFRGQRVSGFIQKPYTAKELAESVNARLG